MQSFEQDSFEITPMLNLCKFKYTTFPSAATNDKLMKSEFQLPEVAELAPDAALPRKVSVSSSQCCRSASSPNCLPYSRFPTRIKNGTPAQRSYRYWHECNVCFSERSPLDILLVTIGICTMSRRSTPCIISGSPLDAHGEFKFAARFGLSPGERSSASDRGCAVTKRTVPLLARMITECVVAIELFTSTPSNNGPG